MEDTVTDNRLIGKYTPVNTELKLITVKPNNPGRNDKKALFKGFLFLPILCIKTKNINALK